MSEVRSMWKFFRDNIWLGVFTVVAISALAAALVAIGGLGQVQDQREADRIADGVSSCQRGNLNRQIQAQQFRDVVTVLVASRGEDVVEQVLSVIEPVLERTPVTDCSDVITGADPSVADFPP